MLKRIFEKKKILVEILFIFLLSLTPLLWFRPGEMMVGHDNVFPLDPKTFLKGRFYTWIENQGFGQDQSLIMGTIPIHLIDALPSFLGFSLINTQKIVYVFWFFLIGLSVYLLASLINPKSRFFKLTATVFYQFNFFVLQGWWIGERTKFSALIAMPLILSVFLLIHREKIGVLRGIIYNSLILFFFNAGGLFGIPLYGGCLVAIITFVLFFSVISFFQKRHSLGLKLIFSAILIIPGFFLVNAYYLLPLITKVLRSYQPYVSQVGSLSGLVAWAQEVSAKSSFINLFRLEGIAEWYDNPEHPYAKYYFENFFLILVSFIWPFLVFLSLVLIKNRKKIKFVLYFFLVYLVALFFTAGAHPPLGFIYVLLVKFIPGFLIFRSPYFKFAPALFLSSAFLCAFSLDFIKEKLVIFTEKKPKLKFLPLAFCLFWLVLWLGYYFPYFTGDFFNWREGFSTRLKIPNYIFDFSDWLEHQWEADGRILMLPAADSRWQYDLYKWGYLSFQALPRLFSNKPAVVIGENLQEKEKFLFDLVNQTLLDEDKESFETITASLGIKYLVIRKDFVYDLDWTKTENPLLLKKIIKENFVYSLKKEFGEWELYEINPVPLPEIFTFQKIDVVELAFRSLGRYFSLNKKYQKKFILNETLVEEAEMLDNFYFAPECLNCGHETGIDVVFPKSKILPDSPFYPLIILKEKRGLKKGDLKAQIYNQIGLTLKRIGEIQRLTALKKEIKIAYLDTLLVSIRTIISLFNQFEKFDEKVKIAEDINFFLEKERQFFSDLIGSVSPNQEKITGTKRVISIINSLQEVIDPWLFKKERSNNRLYYFTMENEVSYEILVNSQSIKGAFPNEGEFVFEIDDYDRKTILVDSDKLKDDWINLGELRLKKGRHKMSVSLPKLPNLVSQLKAQEQFFWSGMGTCFAAEIANYNPYKDYLLKFYYYQNDFPYEPNLFITRKGSRVTNEEIFQFLPIRMKGFFEDIVRGDKRTEEVKIAICTPEFLDDALFKQRKINVEVKEIIYPLIVLRLKTPSAELLSPQIEFERINPTKYHLKVKGAQSPYFLGFRQKFDSNWRLYQQGKKVFDETHFNLNAHANGWLINEKGDHDLILEYLPQRVFYKGIGLSLVSLLVMIFYLFIQKKR